MLVVLNIFIYVCECLCSFCHCLEPAIWAIIRVSDKLLWLWCIRHATLSRLVTGARSPCLPLTNCTRETDKWPMSQLWKCYTYSAVCHRILALLQLLWLFGALGQCCSEAEVWAVGAVSADGAASWSCWPGTPTKHPSCVLTSSAWCSACSHEPLSYTSFTAGYPKQMENCSLATLAVLFSHFALSSMYY